MNRVGQSGLLDLQVGLDRHGDVSAHVVIDLVGPQGTGFLGVLGAELHVAGEVKLILPAGLPVRGAQVLDQVRRAAAQPDYQAVSLHVEHVQALDVADGQDDAACYHVGPLAVQLDLLAVECGW